MTDLTHSDLQLTQLALQGDETAVAQISQIAHPIITYQSDKLCRRYCFDNFRHFRCSLLHPKPGSPRDADLCEWGNACYHWILEDLCKHSRLQAYQAKGGAGLQNYFYSITRSQAFFERWKDWRFGQRTYVPTYIQSLHEFAGRIFMALKAQEEIPNIAQRIGLGESEAFDIADQIIIELTKRKRLHLLEQTRFISIDHAEGDEDDDRHWEIPHHDMPFEQWQQYQCVQTAWEKLDPTEQFVIEALVIEELDANTVLEQIRQENIQIKKGLAPEDTDRQQLYYFRRKALSKLAQFAGIE